MLTCNADDIAARYITRRPENRSISSDFAFGQIKEWFNRCHDSHDACRVLADSYVPSYLIQITAMGSGELNLRLVSKPATAPYVALSYCWGIDQNIKATTSTLEDLRRNIDYFQLPKTMRDAIITTQKLGLQFLWVDALCIVQDDEIHTAHEIANMRRVYQNAHVTISAARARGCDQGFLHNIQRPGLSADAFRLSFLAPDMTVGSIVCFYEHDTTHVADPIEGRAWTMQEYVLSPRVLKFSVDERSWICLSSNFDDNDQSPASWWKRVHRNKFNTYRTFHRALTRSFTLISWSDVVFLYSSRNMSDPNDILLAISGIADYIWQIHKGTYVAGMWREHFPGALMWQRDATPYRRPRQYRAPSWSWAAIDGIIEYAEHDCYDRDFTLISVDLVLKSPQAPFGAVTGGSITVRGWLRLLFMRQTGVDRYILVDVNGETSADCYPDSEEDCLKELVVWCLQVSPYNEDTGQGSSGIILTTKDGKVYRRRGLFSYSSVDDVEAPERERRRCWIEKCSLKDIIIE
jgi:hypothetical protein